MSDLTFLVLAARVGLCLPALLQGAEEKEKPLYRGIRTISTVPDWLSTRLLEAFDVDRVVIANLDPSKVRAGGKPKSGICDRHMLLAIALGMSVDANLPREPDTTALAWLVFN